MAESLYIPPPTTTTDNDNSGTSKYGWSGSTLGAASGGPKPRRLIDPNDWTGFIVNSEPEIIETFNIPDILTTTNNTIKPAGKELNIKDIKIKESKQPENMALLLLQNIGGREISMMSRHQEINGVNQEYSPIANISDVSLQYSPLAISPNSDTTTYLDTFSFDIGRYVPTQAELNDEYPLETDANKRSVVYFDKTTNSLVVHIANSFLNEKIEVQFIVPQEVKDGTIYT